MYKASKGISSEFSRALVHLVFNGTETASFWCSKIWDLVPHEIKQKESVAAFAKSIMPGTHVIFLLNRVKKCCQHRVYLNYDSLGLKNFYQRFIQP